MQTNLLLQIIQLLAPFITELIGKLKGTDPKYASYTPGQMFDEALANSDKLQAKLDAAIAGG